MNFKVFKEECQGSCYRINAKFVKLTLADIDIEYDVIKLILEKGSNDIKDIIIYDENDLPNISIVFNELEYQVKSPAIMYRARSAIVDKSYDDVRSVLSKSDITSDSKYLIDKQNKICRILDQIGVRTKEFYNEACYSLYEETYETYSEQMKKNGFDPNVPLYDMFSTIENTENVEFIKLRNHMRRVLHHSDKKLMFVAPFKENIVRWVDIRQLTLELYINFKQFCQKLHKLCLFLFENQLFYIDGRMGNVVMRNGKFYIIDFDSVYHFNKYVFYNMTRYFRAIARTHNQFPPMYIDEFLVIGSDLNLYLKTYMRCLDISLREGLDNPPIHPFKYPENTQKIRSWIGTPLYRKMSDESGARLTIDFQIGYILFNGYLKLLNHSIFMDPALEKFVEHHLKYISGKVDEYPSLTEFFNDDFHY